MTQLGAFTSSPLGAFERSPLGARNNPVEGELFAWVDRVSLAGLGGGSYNEFSTRTLRKVNLHSPTASFMESPNHFNRLGGYATPYLDDGDGLTGSAKRGRWWMNAPIGSQIASRYDAKLLRLDDKGNILQEKYPAHPDLWAFTPFIGTVHAMALLGNRLLYFRSAFNRSTFPHPPEALYEFRADDLEFVRVVKEWPIAFGARIPLSIGGVDDRIYAVTGLVTSFNGSSIGTDNWRIAVLDAETGEVLAEGADQFVSGQGRNFLFGGFASDGHSVFTRGFKSGEPASQWFLFRYGRDLAFEEDIRVEGYQRGGEPFESQIRAGDFMLV